MVRIPLSPEQVDAGRRLGALLRSARAGRNPDSIAEAAGISPETLRKIEVGRIASPSFGTVLSICEALDLPIEDAVRVWRAVDDDHVTARAV